MSNIIKINNNKFKISKCSNGYFVEIFEYFIFKCFCYWRIITVDYGDNFTPVLCTVFFKNKRKLIKQLKKWSKEFE